MNKFLGFSLLELLIVLVIGSILAVTSVTSFRKYLISCQGKNFIENLDNLILETSTHAYENHYQISLLIDNQVIYLSTPKKQEIILKVPNKGKLIFKNKLGYNKEIIFLPNGKLLHTRGSFYFDWYNIRWRLVCLENGNTRIEKYKK